MSDALARLMLDHFELRNLSIEVVAKIPLNARQAPQEESHTQDKVLMFKVLVLRTLYELSDDQLEYQVRDRLSSMWATSTS
jgi:IS5 family transposase